MRADRRRRPRARPRCLAPMRRPFLRGMVEHVRKDCTVNNIVLVLRARFGKALASATADRLRKCPQEELDELLCRCAVGTTLEEALRVQLDSAVAVIAGGGVSKSRRKDD
jgi:hypothetical protein